MSQYLMDRINLHADCILTVPLIKNMRLQKKPQWSDR